MAHDVFICYSTVNKTIADAVCATLEQHGIRCWIAPRDVEPGDTWASAVIDALGASRVLVLIFSDGANKSSDVLNEIAEAIDKDIPVIPFRIENVLPSKELSYFIKRLHWLDALTPPLEQHLEHLTRRVAALLSVDTGPAPERSAEVAPPGVQESAKPHARQSRFLAVAFALAVILLVAVGWLTHDFWGNLLISSSPTPTTNGLTAAPTPTATAGVSPTSQGSDLVTSPPAEPKAAIAVDTEDQIYVAWASQQSGIWDVYFARSEDGGKTFSAAIRPGAGQASRGQPALAAGGDGVYLAWAEGIPDAHNIYYTRIAPSLGVSEPALVNDDTSGSDHTSPSLAVDRQGTLYAAWQDQRNGDWDIYGTRLRMGETRFEASRQLASAPGDEVDPSIATDPQGVLYIAWTDQAAKPDRIVYACGLWPNFATVLPVSGGLVDDLGNSQPALAVASAGRAHLAWANAYVMHPQYGVLLYLPAYAATVGQSCTPSEALLDSLQQVGSGYRYVSVRPPELAVATTDSTVHVVLTTFSPRDGSYVWYYRAPTGGGEFGEPVVLAHEPNVDVLHYPAIAVASNGVVHVVWAHQYGEQWRLHYTRSEDGGQAFLPEKMIE